MEGGSLSVLGGATTAKRGETRQDKRQTVQENDGRMEALANGSGMAEWPGCG